MCTKRARGTCDFAVEKWLNFISKNSYNPDWKMPLQLHRLPPLAASYLGSAGKVLANIGSRAKP